MTSGETPGGWPVPEGPADYPGNRPQSPPPVPNQATAPPVPPAVFSASAPVPAASAPVIPAQPGPQYPAFGQATMGHPGPGQVLVAPVTGIPATGIPAPGMPVSALPVTSMPGVPVQYAPGQYAPGQYAPGQYAPGQYVPGQYAPPGPYPYPYPVQWPVPAPRPSNGSRLAVILLAVAIVAGVLGVGGLAGFAALSDSFDKPAVWQDAALHNPPPDQDAPATAWLDWARRSVDESVKSQAKALLAGDEAGFTAAADPANATLLADLKRRFTVLRAMGPGVWTETLSGRLRATSSRSWTSDIDISYCFGEKTCVASKITESSRWEVRNDHLVLAELGKSVPDQNGPRPWETDNLSVSRGTRVVVAASKSEDWRLSAAVAAADKAAKVADTFAKWSPAPNRYVIFLAGPSDWSRWYGHEQPDWAAAWAVPVSETVTEVVVRTEVVQMRTLENLLTHELTHVTSLAGKRQGTALKGWWLVEGVAEYATMINQSVKNYDGLEPTRDYVKRIWDGKPNVTPPSVNAELEEAAAKYGIAFLSVRRIADKYGQDKMMDFWGRVVHDNASLETASTAALGTAWTTVSADCAAFVRSSVA